MQEILDKLYHTFYHSGAQVGMAGEVESLHQELIQTLSKADRKKVLKIIDNLMLITLLQSKDSFVSGFQLAMELQTELQQYKQGIRFENDIFSEDMTCVKDDGAQGLGTQKAREN